MQTTVITVPLILMPGVHNHDADALSRVTFLTPPKKIMKGYQLSSY